MDSDADEKSRGFVVGHHHHHQSHPPPPTEPPPPPPSPYYGTFQGIPNYPPPIGFPLPGPAPSSSDPRYYTHPYQSVPVDDERPVRERHHLCCGIGLGWFLFILGFFFAGIPWYMGALILICSRTSIDHREKPGYILCVIAAVLVTIAIVVGLTQGDDYDW